MVYGVLQTTSKALQNDFLSCFKAKKLKEKKVHPVWVSRIPREATFYCFLLVFPLLSNLKISQYIISNLSENDAL